MPIHEHEPTFKGRAFLWAGVGFGLLFLVVFLTHGFGLMDGSGKSASAPESMVRQD